MKTAAGALTEDSVETCAAMLSRDCRRRHGVTEAKNGFIVVLDDGVARFICDDCAQVVKAHRGAT